MGSCSRKWKDVLSLISVLAHSRSFKRSRFNKYLVIEINADSSPVHCHRYFYSQFPFDVKKNHNFERVKVSVCFFIASKSQPVPITQFVQYFSSLPITHIGNKYPFGISVFGQRRFFAECLRIALFYQHSCAIFSPLKRLLAQKFQSLSSISFLNQKRRTINRHTVSQSITNDNI